MNRTSWMVLVLVSSLGLGSSQADDSGWLAKMNPFGGSSAKETHATPAAKKEESKLGWSVWPKSKSKPETTVRTPPPQDNRGFMTKTKETLMPWTKPDKPPTRTASARHPQLAKKKDKENGSFYSKWFQKDEPKPPQQTLSDFVGLPRPTPY